MILTGKAAEFANEFETLEIELGEDRLKPFELTEEDQKDLFMVTMMFERDIEFKEYISGCLKLFATTHRGD